MSNNPGDYAPVKLIPAWVIEDLRWYAEVLAGNGNATASRKILAQIQRGTGVSRTLLATAWDNTFSGGSGENPADEETRGEFGRLLLNIDELSRPRVDYSRLKRPGWDEGVPRGPGRQPLPPEQVRRHRVSGLLTDAERAAFDKARGSQSTSEFVRAAILARLEPESE